MAKTNKEGYTLQYCIEHSEHIRNGKHVYNVLKEAGIDDWNTLVNMYANNYLPVRNLKGIGEKTWPVIIRMAEKEEWNRNPLGRLALIEAVRHACIEEGCEIHNSYGKIINALRRYHIYTLEQLWGAPDIYIQGIRGFGPRMLSILDKIRKNEIGSHEVHFVAFIEEFDRQEYFKAAIHDAWKSVEKSNEQENH